MKIPKQSPGEFKPTSSLETSFSQSTGVSYLQRSNAGQAITSFNKELGMRGDFHSSKTQPLGIRCQVSTNDEDFENIKQRYRYMYTSLSERVSALEFHRESLQADMCEAYNIPLESIQPLGTASQEPIWVSGRVQCETAEGKINKASIVLQGSGRRVQLDVSELSSFSLFSGQVVLVEGVCSNGKKITAKRIIEGVNKPKLTSLPSKLLEFHHSAQYQGGEPLKIMTASGPFTPSDNLNYQPLLDFLSQVVSLKPDVVILTGPFVDVSQPLLASGDVTLEDEENGISPHNASFEMVFIEKVIRDGFMSLFNNEEDGEIIPTNFILIPSLLDGHHEMVFPQPPFGDRDRVVTEYFEEPLGILNIPFSKDKDIRKRVHLMPNPSMFRVNEVLFGVCSNDLLFSMSSDEISQGIEGNRLLRLSSHILQQQSFNPQFPVPSNLLSQVDFRQQKHWKLKLNPDILILPSKLSVLAKDIQNTLVVNPGFLVKGNSGGSYAEISIHPFPKNKLDVLAEQENSRIPHDVPARASVNIVRI